MNLNDYEQKIVKFDLYPKWDNYTYFLGVGGEGGEIDGKVADYFTRNHAEITKQVTFQEELEKELGDQLWYTARIASRIGISIQEVYDKALVLIPTLDMEFENNHKLFLLLLAMSGARGKLLERMKKIIRDGNGQMEERDSTIFERLVRIMAFFILICKHLGVSVQRIAEINYHKLSSRLERKMLRGSGDNR